MGNNVKNDMEEVNSKSIGKLAELFIKEPSSLEVLLMLTDEGPKAVEQISNKIIFNMKIIDKLRLFKAIDIKDNMIYITSFGKSLVLKMRQGIRMRQKYGRHEKS